MQISSTTFNRQQLDEFNKPCVYVMKSSDGTILYIGYSDSGYARVFDRKNYRHPKRDIAKDLCDSLSITFFDSKEEASAEEDRLIHIHHPAYNKACATCEAYGHSKINGPNPERRASTSARHHRTAEELTNKFGFIPGDQWLVRNGYNSLAVYMRYKPEIFIDFKRAPDGRFLINKESHKETNEHRKLRE